MNCSIFEKCREYDIEFNSKLLIGKFPNTYTFTKNLAENLVNQEFKKGGLPTAIVRPGIVSTSLREPFCGWFDSITSIMGGFVSVVSGLARHSLANPNITTDYIPVDIVANTCIAAATNSINK
jgi:fatty acyl-CoA reductase